MKNTRWGLIGAGWIATTAIAPAMHAAENTVIQAVEAETSNDQEPLTRLRFRKAMKG